MKSKRVNSELKKVITLAQSRRWTRAGFLSKVRQLWGETKDVIKEQDQEEWMKQIRL